MVTFLIDLIGGESDQLFGTSVDTETATLTKIGIECKFCHKSFTFLQINNTSFAASADKDFESFPAKFHTVLLAR